MAVDDRMEMEAVVVVDMVADYSLAPEMGDMVDVEMDKVAYTAQVDMEDKELVDMAEDKVE